MKRIADEDQATYRYFPHKLNERYLLMSLLGKGGFSEVYKVCTYICVCMYVLYVCIYVCMFVCICIYICMYMTLYLSIF